MRAVRDIKDVQIALNEVFDFVDSFRSRNIDLSRRRIINAGPSVDDFDYVIKFELYNQGKELRSLIQELKDRVGSLELRMTKAEKSLADVIDRITAHGI